MRESRREKPNNSCNVIESDDNMGSSEDDVIEAPAESAGPELCNLFIPYQAPGSVLTQSCRAAASAEWNECADICFLRCQTRHQTHRWTTYSHI